MGDRFALEALRLGDAPLGLRASKLQGLHQLGSVCPHLRIQALERLRPTPGQLGGERAGRRVDDLGGRPFDDRVRERLGVQILNG
jgi:hypothetical protein